MGTQGIPAISARTRSASWPSTTTTGSRPAFVAVPSARLTTVSPSSASRSLFCPIRVDNPAARITAATVASDMDSPGPFSQVLRLSPRVHRQQFCHDAQTDLLGTVRADVEADRSENASTIRAIRDAELGEHLLGP